MFSLQDVSDTIYLPSEYLTPLAGTSLFYPSSGKDLTIPVLLAGSVLTDFWFVDPIYHHGRKTNMDTLFSEIGYTCVAAAVDGDITNSKSTHNDIDPCIVTTTYQNEQTKKQIRIHLRRGCGFSALRTEKKIGTIGIFFYRGDSGGEGGSGNLWLQKQHLKELIPRMPDGGLIVTDGSSSNRRGPFCRNISFTETPGETLTEKFKNFTAAYPSFQRAGALFTCVGYAGFKYGPTMIWQIKKRQDQASVSYRE